MPFVHKRTVAKGFVYALSWLDTPNTIQPASAIRSGFCHCQSLWYSEEMLAQEGQQSLISKCIWNPLSLLLEPLQNQSGYKPFFPSSGYIIVTKTSTTDSFSRETLAFVVQRLSMLRLGWLNCISFESTSESRLSSAARWGVGSNCWLFFLQGRQAAYGVLPVTQTVNFHQLFCGFSNSGIRRDRFFTIPSNISQSYFPSLCFCAADSLSVALFCWGDKHLVWDWGGFSGCGFLAVFTQGLCNNFANLKIVLNLSTLYLYTHANGPPRAHMHTHTRSPPSMWCLLMIVELYRPICSKDQLEQGLNTW